MSTTPTLAPVPGLASTSAAFRSKLFEVSSRLGINPDWLAAVMSFESGLRSTARNASGAVGLIQFMPATARSLGTTAAELLAMSPEAQLDYVERYFAAVVRQRGKLNTINDVALAVFAPAFVGSGDGAVMYRDPTPAYTQNRTLDRDGKGFITSGDYCRPVRAILAAAKGERLDAGGLALPLSPPSASAPESGTSAAPEPESAPEASSLAHAEPPVSPSPLEASPTPAATAPDTTARSLPAWLSEARGAAMDALALVGLVALVWCGKMTLQEATTAVTVIIVTRRRAVAGAVAAVAVGAISLGARLAGMRIPST